MNYPTYNLQTVKDNHKSELFVKPRLGLVCPSSGICCGLDKSGQNTLPVCSKSTRESNLQPACWCLWRWVIGSKHVVFMDFSFFEQKARIMTKWDKGPHGERECSESSGGVWGLISTVGSSFKMQKLHFSLSLFTPVHWKYQSHLGFIWSSLMRQNQVPKTWSLIELIKSILLTKWGDRKKQCSVVSCSPTSWKRPLYCTFCRTNSFFFSPFRSSLSFSASCHAGQSYPDPMVGASRSFIHRISELSSLEGETVRQEKLKKMRKPRKPPSWQSPSSQSRRLRIKTSESVPTTSEQNKTLRAPCSFQWLVLTACLSSVTLVSCLTWLIFTFWDSWPELLSFSDYMWYLLW